MAAGDVMVASVKTVDRIFEIILEYVPKDHIQAMFEELAAVPGNASFIATIKRLQEKNTGA